MRIDPLGRLAFWGCAAAGVHALAACGAGAPAAAPAIASQTERIDARGGSLAFPLVGGYTATVVYGPNGGAAATAVLTTATAPGAKATVPGGLQPAGVQLASFTFELSAPVRFARLRQLPAAVTLPPLFPAAGHNFEIAGYDLTLSVGIGENIGSVNGNVVTFGDEFGPVTLGADTYLFVLTME